MPIDSELEEILLKWDELRDRERPGALEDLCRDHPGRIDEVRRIIGVLQNLEGLIGDPTSTPTLGTVHGPTDSRPPDEILTGSHCRATHLHARGGLGEVFVAWDKELGREVALKLIQRPFEGDPDRRERFIREAEITARLGHPGIVPVFGIGRTADGRPCYTMRYIEGETLHAAIRRFHDADRPDVDAHERTLAFRSLLSRLVAVCQAVAFAHSRGVIHRDLKPDNIMLGPFQETLVVDWGLGKRWRRNGDKTDDGQSGPNAVRDQSEEEPKKSEGPISDRPDARDVVMEDDNLTRMGSTLGTPAYMSPEQASGLWDEVGPASDVYSLGSTLYLLLTGQPAFRNRSRSALLDRVRRGQFTPPRQAKGGVAPALAAICVKAMALRPDERYPSAAEMAADLERWLGDEPVSAWKEPPLVRLGRWVRRHGALVAGSAALAGSALIALAVSTLLLGREQTKTMVALGEAQKNYRLSRTTLADMQTSFGLAAADRGSTGEAAVWFAEAASTAAIDPERALASRIRVRGWCELGPAPVAQLEFRKSADLGDDAKPSSTILAFDKRGRYLLAVLRTGACAVADILEDRSVSLPGGRRSATAAAWGGVSGDLLALGDRDGLVELVRIPEAQIVERLQLKGPVSTLTFSRDGNLLVVGCETSRIWNIAQRTYVTPVLPHHARVVQLALNTEADRLAMVTPDGVVRVFDLSKPLAPVLFQTSSGTLAGLRSSGKLPVRLAFVDQGRGIVTAPSDAELEWLDATTGTLVRRLPTGLLVVHDVLTSPDGRAFTVTGGGGVRSWDAGTGRLLGSFGEAGIEAASFTPDGSKLLLANGYAVASPHQFPSGEPGGWVLRHQDPASRVAVTQDGAHFAIAQCDGLVRVWRFPKSTADEEYDELSGTPLGFRSTASVRLAMSADGRLVMPLAKAFSSGVSFTRVHDVVAHREGPDLRVEGVLHGGAIAPDGRQVVTLSASPGPSRSRENGCRPGSSVGWIKFWDWERGVSILDPIPTPTAPVAAAYSPDGRRVVILCNRGECLWVDPVSGQVTHVREADKPSFRPQWPAGEWLRFSADGKFLVHWGMGQPVLMDAISGSDHVPPLSSPPYGLLDARFSPDGRYLATVGGDKTAQIWDLATGRHAAPPLVHPDWVFQAAFSADGRLLLTGCRDATARVWDWRAGKLVGQPMTHQGEVQDVAFLDGDRWVVTKSSDKHMRNSGGNSVQTWSWRTGKLLTPPRLLPSAWGSQLRVAQDGRLAVLGGASDQSLHVVDLARCLDSADPRFPAGHLREIAELWSGHRIVGESSAVSLTSAEWSQRWRSYRTYTRDSSSAGSASGSRPVASGSSPPSP